MNKDRNDVESCVKRALSAVVPDAFAGQMDRDLRRWGMDSMDDIELADELDTCLDGHGIPFGLVSACVTGDELVEALILWLSARADGTK